MPFQLNISKNIICIIANKRIATINKKETKKQINKNSDTDNNVAVTQRERDFGGVNGKGSQMYGDRTSHFRWWAHNATHR